MRAILWFESIEEIAIDGYSLYAFVSQKLYP